MAERGGFEPPEPFGSIVFKTTAIGHSAISPTAEFIYFFLMVNGIQDGECRMRDASKVSFEKFGYSLMDQPL